MEGPDPHNENKPEQIEKALKAGFNVEVDLWSIDGKFYFGHDKPEHEIPWNFVDRREFWVHCKNLNALYILKHQYPLCQYFWHESDAYTLTSGNYNWTYPGYDLTEHSICVLPERTYTKDIAFWPTDCYGICSDFVGQFQHK